MKISVCIASYRDIDLKNTVSSAFYNAKNKKNISFSIVSQAEEKENPDLSEFPVASYKKFHWSESRGVCWARSIAVTKSDSDFILQVDSHSRFPKYWDELILNSHNRSKQFWGERIVLSQYPYSFWISDGKDYMIDLDEKLKTFPVWDKAVNNIQIGKSWKPVIDKDYGDEVFYWAGGCSFAKSNIFREVIPDPDIYFGGEEFSLAIRAYTRGIRLINSPENFVYSNFDRKNYNRRLHWEDHEHWFELEKRSREKLLKIYRGELRGRWGIYSNDLYEKFIKLNNLEVLKKIESVG